MAVPKQLAKETRNWSKKSSAIETERERERGRKGIDKENLGFVDGGKDDLEMEPICCMHIFSLFLRVIVVQGL